MRCITTILFLLVISSLSAQNTFQESIYFDVDKHDLTTDAKSALDQLSTEIHSLEDYEITLLAHTDDQGSLVYNKQLAKHRAAAVAHYLQGLNLPSKSTDIQNFGEENPSYSNQDELGRRKNRRVDIIVQTSSALNLDALFGQWEQEQRQQYTINGSKDTKLIGENGTAIWIAASALIFEDGSPAEGNIEITLQEAHNYGDMLMADLSTHSDDLLLETGGMIYLDAKANGKSLQIKEGESLIVALPRSEFKDDMLLFEGETTPTNTVENWAVTEQRFGKDLNSVLNFGRKPSMPIREISMYKADLSNKPQNVNAPKMPARPRPPKAEQQRFFPNFWQKLKWNDKKIAQEEETRYKKAVVDYEKRMTYYPKRLAKYKQQQKEYAKYKQDVLDWESAQQTARIAFHAQANEKKQEQLALYRAALKKWKAKRLEKIMALENFEEFGNKKMAVLSAYFSNVTNLGWINCDRFYSIPESEKMQLAINDKDDLEERIYVVFKDTNALIRTHKKATQYWTNSIPKGANVTIVGLKFEGRKAMLAELNIKTKADISYELEYKPYPIKELKTRLMKLNQNS